MIKKKSLRHWKYTLYDFEISEWASRIKKKARRISKRQSVRINILKSLFDRFNEE